MKHALSVALCFKHLVGRPASAGAADGELYFAKGWRVATCGKDVRNSVGVATSERKILLPTYQVYEQKKRLHRLNYETQ